MNAVSVWVLGFGVWFVGVEGMGGWSADPSVGPRVLMFRVEVSGFGDARSSSAALYFPIAGFRISGCAPDWSTRALRVWGCAPDWPVGALRVWGCAPG
jgi:hypothetical protein